MSRSPPLARDGGNDPDARGAQRQRQVIGKVCDLVDHHARAGSAHNNGDDRTEFHLDPFPSTPKSDSFFSRIRESGDQGFPFDSRNPFLSTRSSRDQETVSLKLSVSRLDEIEMGLLRLR